LRGACFQPLTYEMENLVSVKFACKCNLCRYTEIQAAALLGMDPGVARKIKDATAKAAEKGSELGAAIARSRWYLDETEESAAREGGDGDCALTLVLIELLDDEGNEIACPPELLASAKVFRAAPIRTCVETLGASLFSTVKAMQNCPDSLVELRLADKPGAEDQNPNPNAGDVRSWEPGVRLYTFEFILLIAL
jgi:hypothetical protein